MQEADAQLRLSRRTWSVDNGFECVEVDWGRPFDPGSDPEDPQGLPRVLLALETAQWSSMRRKAKEAPVARPAAEKKDIDNEFWLLDGAHIDQLSDTIAEVRHILGHSPLTHALHRLCRYGGRRRKGGLCRTRAGGSARPRWRSDSLR